MARLIMGFADLRNPHSLASKMRRQRHRLFHELTASIPRPIRVLDVGGTAAYWLSQDEFDCAKIAVTLLNQEPPIDQVPGFHLVKGDARDLSQYADKSFDVAFSNSVIEHVGGFADMLRMANEVRRVGRCYMVQTPNLYFPMEPHFHIPLFQFMPHRIRAEFLSRRDLGWVPREPELEEALRVVRSVRLLTRRRLGQLFPDATIHSERILGLSKSFIALRSVG